MPEKNIVIAQNEYVDICQNPNGGQIFVKEKYKGVVVLPVDYTGNILLLRHRRYVEKEPMLEIPRGIMNSGETYARGAMRELYEETNIKISEEDIEELGRIHADSGLINENTMIVLARVKEFSEVKCNDANEKILGYQIVTITELADLIHKNIITDGFTLAAFSMFVAEDYLY